MPARIRFYWIALTLFLLLGCSVKRENKFFRKRMERSIPDLTKFYLKSKDKVFRPGIDKLQHGKKCDFPKRESFFYGSSSRRFLEEASVSLDNVPTCDVVEPLLMPTDSGRMEIPKERDKVSTGNGKLMEPLDF